MKVISVCLLWLSLSSSAFSVAQRASAEVYFSPDDQVDRKLIELIEQERKSIRMAVYCLTHRAIGQALIDAKKRGVDVEVIVDRFSVKTRSPLAKMIQGGIPIYVWNSERQKKKRMQRSLMHNKYCIFGNDIVWSGSLNFTQEGPRIHQENVLILRDEDLALAYKMQFDKIKWRSCTPYAAYVAYQPKRQYKRAS